MTQPTHEGGARYATLRDYLRVIARRRWLILLATLLFTAGGLAYSLNEESTYEAEAQLSASNIGDDLDRILTGDPFTQRAPGQQSAATAESITGPEVSRRAKRELKANKPADELAEAIDARVVSQTNLVTVEASAPNAERAAERANAFATAAVRQGRVEGLDLIDEAKRSIRDDLRTLPPRDEPGGAAQRAEVRSRLSALKTLEDTAQPIEITERAEVPEDRASPNVTQNTVIAGLLGLVLGLLAAFVRDSLDRRVHSVQDVHDELGVPVLGRVRESAFGHPGLAMNGGMTMSDEDFEAFRVLRANLGALAPGRDTRSILVTSVLAGAGKSTVSAALASAAAIAGQRALLAECDMRRPSFAERLGLEATPGLSDYLRGSAEPSEILRTVDLGRPGDTGKANGASTRGRDHAGSLVAIPAGSPVDNSAELLVTERFLEFLGQVSKVYDLVVLDCGPLLAVVDPMEVVPYVDGVLMCVRVRDTTREQVRAARAVLGNLPERPMGAVVTGLGRRGQDEYDYYYGGD